MAGAEQAYVYAGAGTLHSAQFDFFLQNCTRCGRMRNGPLCPREKSTKSGTAVMTTGCWQAS